MANYLYNGVELPDINTVWTDKETYPYAIIGAIEPGVEGYYALGLYTTTGVYNSGNRQVEASSSCSYLAYVYGSGEYGEYDSWTLIDQSDSAQAGSALSYEPVTWSNYDMLSEDGSVYLAASDPVPVGDSKLKISVGGGNCLYNGVELPALPEYDTEKYPYAYLTVIDSSTLSELFGVEVPAGECFVGLNISSIPCAIASSEFAEFNGTISYKDYICAVGDTIAPLLELPNGEWFVESESDNANITGKEVNLTYLVWCNQDLLNADGTVYMAGSEPVSGGGEVTATTATVSFTCSDLESTESVYQIYAWVYKTADGLDTTITPTWTSDVFAGTSHSESHTFEGLSPNTEYSVYGVIYANGAGTDQNATATFTTAEGEANYTLTVTNQIVTADDCLFEVQVGGLPTYNVDDTSTWFQLKATLSNGTSKETGVGSTFDTGSFYFDGLEPDTDYSITFELFRVNTDGSTGASTGITLTDSFTTEADDPFADSRIGPVNETVSENTFSLDIEYRNLPDPSTIVEGDTGYIIKGYTDQGDVAVFEAIEGYGDGMVSGYFSDLEYGTDYIATFVLCHQDGTSTGVTCTTTFTTERKGYDRDSFLAGLASGLAMTGATVENADNHSWCQGYIVGESMRMGL